MRRGLTLPDVADFASITGKGVTGRVNGRVVAVGNDQLVQDPAVAGNALEPRIAQLRSGGATVMYVAIDGKPAGVIAVADPIKATTRAALDALRAQGIRIVMLTGDHRATALAVASQLGIDEVEAQVLPEQKHAIVRALRGAGRIVAMAGDGVNDAPALAEADVASPWAAAPTLPCRAPASRW